METIQMIQKVFRDDAISAVKQKHDTNASQVVDNLLKAIHFLEGLQQAEHLSMLNVTQGAQPLPTPAQIWCPVTFGFSQK